MQSKNDGMEKRGVVAYGWTPPAGSQVSTQKNKTFRECVAQPIDENKLDKLDNDFMKEASEIVARRKK